MFRWINHPAARMWRGHSYELAYYGVAICDEWIKRGYKDQMMDRFINRIEELRVLVENYSNPPWVGNPNFHQSHRANLLRKNYDHYSKYFMENDYMNTPYFWPK